MKKECEDCQWFGWTCPDHDVAIQKKVATWPSRTTNAKPQEPKKCVCGIVRDECDLHKPFAMIWATKDFDGLKDETDEFWMPQFSTKRSMFGKVLPKKTHWRS